MRNRKILLFIFGILTYLFLSIQSAVSAVVEGGGGGGGTTTTTSTTTTTTTLPSCPSNCVSSITQTCKCGTQPCSPPSGGGTSLYCCQTTNACYPSQSTCQQQCGICTGSISLSLNPTTAEKSQTITVSFSGLNYCSGKTIYIKSESCNGATACSISFDSSTSCTFTAPSTTGTYIYYACIDKNGDNDYSDSGESASQTLSVVEYPTCESVCRQKYGRTYGSCILDSTANKLGSECNKLKASEFNCNVALKNCWCYDCMRYCESGEVTLNSARMANDPNDNTRGLMYATMTLSISESCKADVSFSVKKNVDGPDPQVGYGVTTVTLNSGKNEYYVGTFQASECGDYHFDASALDQSVNSQDTNGDIPLACTPSSSCGMDCPDCQVRGLFNIGCWDDNSCSCVSCQAGNWIDPTKCMCWGGSCKSKCDELCTIRGYAFEGCKLGSEVGLIKVSNQDSSCDTQDYWFGGILQADYECYCKCNNACGPNIRCGYNLCGAGERCVFNTSMNNCWCKPDPTCLSNPCSGKADGTACSVNNQNGICCNQECRICNSTYCGSSLSCGSTYYCVYENNQWKWKTSKPSNFCCSDENCKDAQGNWRYDPVNHTKIVCDCPSGSCSYPSGEGKKDDYTCKPLPKCDVNEQCAPGWCCTADPALGADKEAPGSCSYNSTNPIYKSK
ncbi:MAG: hypothetical protein QXU74_01265, partial [Candidatus Aenigmatarchaeota archaeon]